MELMTANHDLESQLQEEELKKLRELTEILRARDTKRIYEIYKLQVELVAKTEELSQLIEISNDYLARIAKHMKTGIPYCNRTFECLLVRLKMPQFTCLTLQPLFEACPKIEVIISEKAKRGFYHNMIELQNFLMKYAFSRLHKGLMVTQEYFFYMDEPAGFLKAQINMTQCSLPNDKILRLFDYEMIDWIIFNRPKESYIFGEKMKLIVGNITTIVSLLAQIYSFPPKSHKLTEEPAQHEIFPVPIQLAHYYVTQPRYIQFMDTMDFYLFLEQEKRRKY